MSHDFLVVGAASLGAVVADARGSRRGGHRRNDDGAQVRAHVAGRDTKGPVFWISLSKYPGLLIVAYGTITVRDPAALQQQALRA
jgi:hypothetical protein